MIAYLNEILWAGLFVMQAATELQFSHENLRIYLKILLLKSWDDKVHTGNISLLIGNLEKLEHRKLRGSKQMKTTPTILTLRQCYGLRREGRLRPPFSTHAVSRHGF